MPEPVDLANSAESHPTNPGVPIDASYSTEAGPASQGANGDADVPELRIALAMCGGIALTLYEAGVSHEIYRFFKAWEQRHDQSPLPNYDQSTPAERLQSTAHGYRSAFQQIPIRPVIDILTGASAGGINSVFLGSCVATGRDFAHFHDIWIDEADIGKMKVGHNDVVRGLLNTSNLSRQMKAELEQNLAAYQKASSRNQAPEDPDLFVRLCRTHHYGHLQITHDAIGHRIEVEQKADVINFRTKHFRSHSDGVGAAQGPGAVRGIRGAKDSRQIEELTNAALATSAFPAMFPPIFDRADGRWYVDGGLWNNQPIDLAVEAIQDKPAFSRTHRCLLFVEPNPTLNAEESSETDASGDTGRAPHAAANLAPSDPVAAYPETEPSTASIVSGLLFMGLKGNIWPALEEILRFNTRRHLYDGLARDPAAKGCVQQIGQSQFAQSRRQAEQAKQWVAAQNKLRDAEQKDTEHDDAGGGDSGSSDGGDDSPPSHPVQGVKLSGVELTALNRRRLHLLLFDGDPALIRQWEAMLERLGCYSFLQQRTAKADAALSIALAALKTVGLCDIEQWLLRRRLQTVNKYLSAPADGAVQNRAVVEAGETSPEPPPNQVTQEVAAHKAMLYTRLEQIREFLYEDADGGTSQPSLYRSSTHRGRSRFRASSEEMLRQLDALFKPFRGSLLPPEVSDRALDILWQWLAQIREQAATVRRREHFKAFRIRPGSWDVSKYQALRLFEEHPLYKRDPLAGDWSLAEEVALLNRELEKDFQELIDDTPNERHLEVAQYLLAALSEVSGKSPIDLIRISGNDTYNQHLVSDTPCHAASGATPAQQKLAGEGLGHVTGFLENRWRRNDYIWGRLDACEILLRTLRHYGAREGLNMTDAQYEANLVEAQTAILQQEAALYKPWYKKRHGREAALECGDCAGLTRSTDPDLLTPSQSQQRQKIQKANTQLIGYGSETILDGDEPELSGNLNYLVQTTVRLLRGSAEKAPAQLDLVARFARIASYVMAVIAALVPMQVHRRTTGNSVKWLAVTAGVVALTGVLSFLLGLNLITGFTQPIALTLKYGALALLLISCGALLGFRYFPLLGTVLFIGIGLGVRLGMRQWPTELGEYWQKPGLLLPLAAAGALLCCFFTLLRWRKSK